MTASKIKDGFEGLKVLVVEDDVLLAMELEDVLRDLGIEVLGPFGRLDQAMSAADADDLDGALLDLNLRGEASFPVVEKLAAKSVPVVICSGYVDLPGMRDQLKALPRIAKPYLPETLADLMRQTFLAQPSRGSEIGENRIEQTNPVSG